MDLDYGFPQFNKNDQTALKKILSQLDKSPRIAEVGCWAGRSTSIIAQHCKENGGQVFAIDHFQGSPDTALPEHAANKSVEEIFCANMKELGLEQYVEVYQVASAAASTMFPNEYFDMIFIDADHLYASIKQDIDLWLPKITPNGIMAGHDFESFEYDERYLGEDCVEGKHHGVIKAVTERFDNIQKTSNLWMIKKG